jgi:hypothetical protein
MKTFTVLTIILALTFSVYQGCKKEDKQVKYCFNPSYFISQDSIIGFAANTFKGYVSCPDTMGLVYKGVIDHVLISYQGQIIKTRIDTCLIISNNPLSLVFSSSEVKTCLFTRQSLNSALQ